MTKSICKVVTNSGSSVPSYKTCKSPACNFTIIKSEILVFLAIFKFCEIPKNSSLAEHLRVTASVYLVLNIQRRNFFSGYLKLNHHSSEITLFDIILFPSSKKNSC